MFAIPKIKAKNRPSSTLVSDILQFKWEDVSKKEEIDRGSFGAVYLTEFNNVPVVVTKLHGRDEDSSKEFTKESKAKSNLYKLERNDAGIFFTLLKTFLQQRILQFK